MRDLAVDQMASMVREWIEVLPQKNGIFFKSSHNDKMFQVTHLLDGSVVSRLQCEMDLLPCEVEPFDVSNHSRFCFSK
jgi:hypothetical protein